MYHTHSESRTVPTKKFNSRISLPVVCLAATTILYNPSLYAANAVNYGKIERALAALGLKTKFTDVDMETNCRFRFLRLEFKGEGVPVPLGQQITHGQLVRTHLHTVIEVWGTGEFPVAFRIVGRMDEPEACDFDRLMTVILSWLEYAKAQPLPDIQEENGIVTIRIASANLWLPPVNNLIDLPTGTWVDCK